MASNSKISKAQKAELKQFKRLNPTVAFAQYDRVTVLARRTGVDMAEFTTSVAGPDEQKIRRKVGEYHAMVRLAWGTAQPVFLGVWDADQMAHHLACVLNDGH